MASQTARDLVAYYSDLLIVQYISRARARGTIGALAAMAILPQATVQRLTLSIVPSAGAFDLSYGETLVGTVAWDTAAGALQTMLRAVSGLSEVVVTGSLASKVVDVAFIGVSPLAAPLVVTGSTLVNGSVPVDVVVSDTDEILPLAVQNGFGIDTAVGNQLNILGKYAGVQRTGFGLDSDITLGDDDFRTLIRFAVALNTAQSDLYSIQMILKTFFPDQIFVYDYQAMRLTYLVSAQIGSPDLIRVLASQNLLPRPMGVQISVMSALTVDTVFSFRTYALPAGPNSAPFNSYINYNYSAPWLSYANSLL